MPVGEERPGKVGHYCVGTGLDCTKDVVIGTDHSAIHRDRSPLVMRQRDTCKNAISLHLELQ